MKEYIVKADHLIDGYGMQAIGELIRCKDCKHQKTFEKSNFTYCGLHYDVMLGEDDGFCNRAERKEE